MKMQHLKNYCEQSSIHGIPQLFDEKRHWVEKMGTQMHIKIIEFCSHKKTDYVGRLEKKCIVTLVSM